MILIPLVAAAIGLSQVPPTQATIAGRVTDAITHRPIAGVKVSYCCIEADAETDASGAYLLHVEAAFPQSRFTITKKGYVVLRPVVPGRPMDRDFELLPSGHLSGRLVDRDSGEPLAGISVTAMGRPVAPGFVGVGRSGKDGSFTFNGEMAPGNYIVRAAAVSAFRFGEGPRDETAALPREYGTTFFPGVASEEAATPVAIAPGEDRSIEIRLRAQERFSMAGAIEAAGDKEIGRLRIALSRNGEGIGNSEQSFRGGLFHLDGLEPGSYVLMLSTSSGAAVNRKFEITDRNVADVRIRLRATAAIRATVTMLEDKAPPPEHTSLRLVPADVEGRPTDPSDSLHIAGLAPGQYWPVLSLSPGYALTGISYGGRPADGAPIMIEAEESTVQFVVTSRPAAVTGVIRDANQNPVGKTLVVISRDPAAPPVDRFGEFRLRATSAANGSFRIADLAPGTYVVTPNGGESRKLDLDFGQTASADLQVK